MPNLLKDKSNETTPSYPYRIVKEKLSPMDLELTDLYIRYGANFYIFSYEKDGKKKHSFIDTGYAGHKDNILPILEKNDIHIQNIENIILTHRHSDHCGLAPYLASQSNARIIVHSGFKPFVDGPVSPEDKVWLRGFEPFRLQECNMEYRNPADSTSSVDIAGLNWPLLGKPIQLGDAGQLEIIGCPEAMPSHTPDQIIIRFTPLKPAHQPSTPSLPTDTILFSGDLWLMQGPVTDKNLRHVKQGLSFFFQKLIHFQTFRNKAFRDPRLQDTRAKESLKYGFVVVRVKPGHGNDFLGTRLIPRALLADRDLLIKLGYQMDDSKALLQNKENKEKLEIIHEDAYDNFIKEIMLWSDLGYDIEQISQLLARIYREQKGGGRLAAQDRIERRRRLEIILDRLLSDKAVGKDVKTIAGNTRLKINEIK